MAYIIVRNSKSGYVSCVEKRRVKNPDGSSTVRDTARICGLGTMTKEEFLVYQKWAHSIKDQDERRRSVLGSMQAVTAQERITTQETLQVPKTTPKKVTKKRPVKLPAVRKAYPVPRMSGYKGRDVGKTHTQIMQERKRAQAEEAERRKELAAHPVSHKKWKPEPYFAPGIGKGKN